MEKIFQILFNVGSVILVGVLILFVPFAGFIALQAVTEESRWFNKYYYSIHQWESEQARIALAVCVFVLQAVISLALTVTLGKMIVGK